MIWVTKLIVASILLATLAGCNGNTERPDREAFVSNSDEHEIEGRSFQNASKYKTWKDGIVHYKLGYFQIVPETARAAVRQAMEHIENRTCIRFQEVKDDNPKTGYVLLEGRLNLGFSFIGDSCFRDMYPQNFTLNAGAARSARRWIQALGFILCFGYENTRLDRDEYLEYKDYCADPNYHYPLLKKKEYLPVSSRHVYDYYSVMHASCDSDSPFCLGVPKQPAYKERSCGNSMGLTVTDIERISDFYDCRGCNSHRWYKIYIESGPNPNPKFPTFVDFKWSPYHMPEYLCRAAVEGSISLGYAALSGVELKCSIYSSETKSVVHITDVEKIRLLGYPGPECIHPVLAVSVNSTQGYRLMKSTDAAIEKIIEKGRAVPLGRDQDNNPLYLAWAKVDTPPSNIPGIALGWTRTWDEAWVVDEYGKAYQVLEFYTLSCD